MKPVPVPQPGHVEEKNRCVFNVVMFTVDTDAYAGLLFCSSSAREPRATLAARPGRLAAFARSLSQTRTTMKEKTSAIARSSHMRIAPRCRLAALAKNGMWSPHRFRRHGSRQPRKPMQIPRPAITICHPP
jgi:hypothetical protein